MASPSSPGELAISPSAMESPRAWSRASVAVCAFVAVGFVLAYAPTMRTLVRQWSDVDSYSFGFLVPFISAYVIWTERARLRLVPVARGYVAGGALVLCSAGLLLAGRLSAIADLQGISLVLMVAGLTWLLLGPRFMRAIAFPVSYLLIMIPVWDLLTDPIRLPLQLISAWLGAELLSLAGVPVHRDLTYVMLPNITLEVANVCSGVNYLIGVVAIGLPLAYLYLRGVARAALVAFGLVVAVIGNGVRVALIGIFAYFQVSALVHGPGHIFTGLFVSFVGFIGLIAALGVLARRFPRRLRLRTVSAQETGRGAERHLVAVGLVAGVLLVGLAVIHPEYSVFAPGFGSDQLTDAGNAWRLVGERVSPPAFIEGDSSGTLVARAFQAPSGERIELFVERLTYNDPTSGLRYRAVLLPQDPTTATMTTGDGVSVRVNRGTARDGGRVVAVAFWYEINGRVIADRKMAKGLTALRMLALRPASANLIVVASNVVAGATDNEVAITRFVQNLLRTPRA